MIQTKLIRPSIEIFLQCFFARADDNDVYVLTQPARTMEEIEEIYAQMPPVEYHPPSARWQCLPRTAAILNQNESELRIIMLGDSIVNDTSRSHWDGLLQSFYPNCKITKITCVRGGTGCWWYKEPGRVKRYVLDYKPHLLIIGGISHNNDTDSIRDVIMQVRAEIDCDILLVTGAFGTVEPRDDEQWYFEINPTKNDYRSKLEQLASEMKAGFLDMTAHWGKYIRESGKELDWFKRDPVHANERGEQILGRILAAHFAPDSRTP